MTTTAAAETILISGEVIRKIFAMEKGLEVVERAFREHGEGRTRMPAKIYLDLPELNGDFRAMPAYLPGMEASGVKWVNSHPGNRARSLPTVMALIILNDPATAVPLAILDGTYITGVRTGAAGGVAAKYLARRESRRLALVGCGAQAIAQLDALRRLFRFERIALYDPKPQAIEALEAEFPESARSFVKAPDARECVRDADIIVTTTPSRSPVLQREWIPAGAHVNAVGADAPGKQELDPRILQDSVVVVDDLEQAIHSGEVNVPIQKGQYAPARIAAHLGEVICGRKPGRSRPEEITVFDSTGLAIQDIAAARFVYDECRRTGHGIRMRF